MTPNDPNYEQRVSLIRKLHQSETELVLALSGGGTLVLGDLLTVPGGSRTVLEASVPYSPEALRDYIGRVPEQYCCQRTARYLAMTSFHRGLRWIRDRKNAGQPVKSPVWPDRRSIDISHEMDDPPEIKLDLSAALDSGANPTRNSDMTRKTVDTTDLDDFTHLIGVGCTASLITDREKRGEYRVHVATQTLRRTIVFTLRLTKNVRTRWEEERLVADFILNAIETSRREALAADIAEALPDDHFSDHDFDSGSDPENDGAGEIGWKPFGLGTTDDYRLREILSLSLKEDEVVQGKQTIGSPPLVDLFFGKTWSVLWRNGAIRHFRLRHELPSPQTTLYNPQAEFSQAIFPGSFNPAHEGHLEMIDIAEQRLGSRVALEISVQNVEKPSLDYIELENRLAVIDKVRPGQAVWLTQTPLFEEKSKLFQGATFVVGADTLRRFAELRFYHENLHQLHDVLRLIGFYNCRFLVFARESTDGLESLRNLDIPDMLRSLSEEIEPAEFTMNISSRELRLNEF